MNDLWNVEPFSMKPLVEKDPNFIRSYLQWQSLLRSSKSDLPKVCAAIDGGRFRSISSQILRQVNNSLNLANAPATIKLPFGLTMKSNLVDGGSMGSSPCLLLDDVVLSKVGDDGIVYSISDDVEKLAVLDEGDFVYEKIGAHNSKDEEDDEDDFGFAFSLAVMRILNAFHELYSLEFYNSLCK